MSNLGGYQVLTSAAKKVGGPKNLVLLMAGGGFVVIRFGEALLLKLFHCKKVVGKNEFEYKNKVFDVTNAGEDSNGVGFSVGDQYRILEWDEDAFLIEKIGDDNNPYFVSLDFLTSISNIEPKDDENN